MSDGFGRRRPITRQELQATQQPPAGGGAGFVLPASVGLLLGFGIVSKAFFEHFEYDDFNDVSVKTDLGFEKKSTLLELHFKISVTVNVN
jgi:hypothetical protein